MLSFRNEGTRGPWLVMLHWLGGGAQTWQEVSHILSRRGVRCLALDLPGFGDSSHVGGFRKRAMADQVADTLRTLRTQLGLAAGEPWLLTGHSMGGSVAALLARRALDGEPGLEGLRGLLLVSPSPPGPEPMDESKRAAMLASLGQSAESEKQNRKKAEQFLEENTGVLPLPEAVRERAVRGVLGMNRTAFRAWLEAGSKEDLREVVGKLALPALVFAGTKEGALGPDAQDAATMPFLPQGRLIPLEGAGHLAPLERPGELAEYFTEFLTDLGLPLATTEDQPGSGLEKLMHSVNTSPRTLEVMTQRLEHSQSWANRPEVLEAGEFRTLRRLAEVVVPEAGFDLASCLEAQLKANKGDGWRFADLPDDREAWKRGLRSLDLAAERAHGVGFAALHANQQAAMLSQAAEEQLGPGLLGSLHLGKGAGAYTATEMKRWMEDVRSEFTRLYMGDPRTMDRIGYTGFADDLGFTQIQLGQQEEFER